MTEEEVDLCTPNELTEKGDYDRRLASRRSEGKETFCKHIVGV